MPPEMSAELKQALSTDCGHGLEPVLELKRPEDHEVLRKLVSGEMRSEPGQRATAIFLLGAWGESSAVEPIVGVLPELDTAERPLSVSGDAIRDFHVR